MCAALLRLRVCLTVCMHAGAHTLQNRGKYCIKWAGTYYIVYTPRGACNVYLVQIVGALLARTPNGVMMYYHVIGGCIYCKYAAVLCKRCFMQMKVSSMEAIQDRLDKHEVEIGNRAAEKRDHPGKRKFFIILNIGLFINALGIMCFKAPNHFAMGGTSGMSIILANLFPQLHLSAFIWFFNILLVVLGLIFLDKKTVGWSVYSSIALSVYVTLLEYAFPMTQPLTNDTLLELAFAVLLPATGSAIAFNIGASTGGTDILAMILKKYTAVEIGKALMLVDAIIVAVSAWLFGPRIGLYCILGHICKAFVVDTVIESVSVRKVCTIISKRPDDVLEFLVKELHRTATVRNEFGGFSGEPEVELVSVLTRREAARLMLYLRRNDPEAFTTIVNSTEILGRGFKGF